VLAVGLLLAAAVVGLHQPEPAQGRSSGAQPGVTVLVAAQDLAAGARLTAIDVRAVSLPPDLVPTGALRSAAGVAGRVVAGPMRRGEPLTDARLLGRGLAAGLSPPESVAVPVRLADAQTAALVRPGDRIDLLATPTDAAGGPIGDPVGAAAGAVPGATQPSAAAADPARAAGSAGRPAGGPAPDAIVLAAALRVLAVLADPQASATDGVLVVVAASDRVARRLTAAAAQQRLSIALRPP
jgi:Flp pilus assembly protein CpaB